MGIKRTHQHEDGSFCYLITPPKPPHATHRSALSDAQLILMGGEVFAVARWNYTGKWHAYDVITGKKIEEFNSEFFEKFIRPRSVEPLLPKPDCVPPRVAATNAA